MYLQIPKTASMWIKEILKPITISYTVHGLPPNNLSQPNIFAFVRNPWAWHVSMYNFLKVGSDVDTAPKLLAESFFESTNAQSFEDFIKIICLATPEDKKKILSTYTKCYLNKLAKEGKMKDSEIERTLITAWANSDRGFYETIAPMYLNFASRIGKHETLKEDIISIMRSVGDLTDELELRILNSSAYNITNTKTDYRTYYNNQLADIVYNSTRFLDQYEYKF